MQRTIHRKNLLSREAASLMGLLKRLDSLESAFGEAG